MALLSPGVEVDIIDQSQYLPTAPNSVPLILLATAQNKSTPDGLSIAPGTTAANANQLYALTSQRDLVNLFGTPFFYKTTNGTPIQGYELNEYGLQTAYNILSITNLVYVVRANIDLAALIGQTGRPSSAPVNGTQWLDTTNSTWGINEFNISTGEFTQQVPTVFYDPADADFIAAGSPPSQTFGNVGDYAITEFLNYSGDTVRTNSLEPIYSTYWYKSGANLFTTDPQYNNLNNTWVAVGSPDWVRSWPMIVGSSLTGGVASAGLTFTVTYTYYDNPELATPNLVSTTTATVTVTSGESLASVAAAINALNIPYVTVVASPVVVGSGGSINFYATNDSEFCLNSLSLNLTSGSGTTLASIGISAYTNSSPYTFYPPEYSAGTSAQQPVWGALQGTPAPSGSVWLKTTPTNNGLNVLLSNYNTTSATWGSEVNTNSTSDWVINAALDSTGGQNIPAGQLYTQIGFGGTNDAPLQTFMRSSNGASTFVGTTPIVDPTMAWTLNTTYGVTVYVSQAGSASLSNAYTVSFTTPGTWLTTYTIAQQGANLFAQAWLNMKIPGTVVDVSGGYVMITSTIGGVIILNDTPFVDTITNAQTQSPLTIMGFTNPGNNGVPLTTTPVGAKFGPYKNVTETAVFTASFSGTTMTVTATNGAPILVGQTLSVQTSVQGVITITGAGTGNGGTGTYTVSATPATLTSQTVTASGIVVGTNGFSPIVGTSSQTTTGGHGSGVIWNVFSNGYDTTTYITPVFGGMNYMVGDVLTLTDTQNGSIIYTIAVRTITGVGSSGPIATAEIIATDFDAYEPEYSVQLSNWQTFAYTPNPVAITIPPANGSYWYYSTVNQVDIMVQKGGQWIGYLNTAFGTNGLPITGSTGSTDPNGPIVAATAPTTNSIGNPLTYGDLWIDTSDLENYPAISRWQLLNGINQWVLIDNTQPQSANGILFADARWAPNGTTDPITDPIPTITSLLVSNYVDLDAPAPELYPQGALLWNTRRSGYNIKTYQVNYFNAQSFPGQILPSQTSTWVSASGLNTQGVPYMGRKAQRNLVVQALQATANTNTQIREEDTFMNLIACPNYPELQPNMVSINNDRGQTAYVVGDTPLRLPATGPAITAWATNATNQTSTNEDGLVTLDTYLGVYYPSGIGSDLTGAQVVLPSSFMMLRTMLYNDNVAYPWYAPAGQNRGIITNVTSIGYLDGQSGEFVVDKNRMSLRDVEYSNQINPIAYFSNTGILNYGNKNTYESNTALDRTNVARLIAYLRYQLQIVARPFLFEPNDALTRGQISGAVNTLLSDIRSKRGIYDYLVVCDETNNTPTTIDANELWVDVAIEPVKAVEFIYIPVRILNTGEIAGLQ
jgi:hypothetical protein